MNKTAMGKINRLIAVLLIAGLCGAAASCASQNTSAGAVQTSSDEQAPVSIVMTYMHNGKVPSDMQDVIEAVNLQTVPAIGVAVEFLPLTITTAQTRLPLLIGTGERIDLMCNVFQDATVLAEQGLILPLNTLVEENAPYIAEASHEFPLFDGSYIDDKFYSIATIGYVYGTAGGYLIKSRYLEEAGLSTQDRRMTLDGLTDVLSSIKSLHPNIYPNALNTTDQKHSNFAYYNIFDAIGGSIVSGGLLSIEATTVENLFETDEYRDYLEKMRQWHLLGLSNPDGAVTDINSLDQILLDQSCGMAMPFQPVIKSDIQYYLSEKMTNFQMTDIYFPSQTFSQSVSWSVPITSAEPSAAIRFLDFTYSNHHISNTILWGIEGRHYVVEDKDKFLIRFPDGISAENSGYFNTYGLYGDRRFEYIWSLDNDRETNAAYTRQATGNKTQAFGYNYSSLKMNTKIIAINQVLAKYLPSLESGSADLDLVYPKFLADLKTAGIDEVIADNQKQFDDWRSGQTTQ